MKKFVKVLTSLVLVSIVSFVLACPQGGAVNSKVVAEYWKEFDMDHDEDPATPDAKATARFVFYKDGKGKILMTISVIVDGKPLVSEHTEPFEYTGNPLKDGETIVFSGMDTDFKTAKVVGNTMELYGIMGPPTYWSRALYFATKVD